MGGGPAAGQAGDMNLQTEHPSLNLAITEPQRDRAEAWLQNAYAAGRLSEDEFDRRIGQVISATTRRDLNLAFYGLVQVPATSQALGIHPAYRPLTPATQQVGRGAAALAHFSGLISWIFGPLLFFVCSPQGSYARKEAAKAFNFQLVGGLVFLGVGILTSIVGDWSGWLMGLTWFAWLLLTIVGGAKAAQGDNWQNPATKAARFKVLDDH